MIETILVALSVLGTGAILLFAAAFFVLAASPTPMAGYGGRSASPASAQLCWCAGCVWGARKDEPGRGPRSVAPLGP